ncbi:TIGR03086 family metal-binding protein [Catenulispora yoronensis]
MATVWADGARTAEADVLAPALVQALTATESAAADFDGHHALLLGMLLEAKQPGADSTTDPTGDPVTETVLAGLDGYLARLAAAGDDEPLTFALVYLLAHLPDSRERILAAATARGLGEDDLSRLTRCLAPCDPEDEISVLKLGRSFPSPAAWTVSDEELREIGGWVQWADLGEHLPALWAGETNTLLGYSGAKALWAVEHGAIADTPEHVVEHDVVDAAPTADADNGSAALSRYLPILRCPACHSPLDAEPEELRCVACGVGYPVKDGYVDIVGGEDEREDPLMARFHEKWLRPAFMRLIGGNWAGEVSFADENRWVIEFMRPADGPIVDLGPGAGITTKTLADKYGAERLIAVDASATMLVRLGRRVPGTASVRADATNMPFADGTVGALNCWNMLHYFDDKAAALHEIGRILQPGGSFTLMDLVPEADHVARYFQGRMGETVVRKLFGPEEIGEWLGRAGMTVQDVYLPGGNFMILRAVRTAEPLPQPTPEAEAAAESGKPSELPQPEDVLMRGFDVFDAVVRQFTDEDWQRPSPCDGWRALDVLGHLGHCMEFSLQLLQGEQPAWTPPQPPGSMVQGSPVEWWDELAGRFRAFVESLNLSREVEVPEGKSNLGAGLSFPALDLFIHGWDIAKSAGLDVEFPADVREFAHMVIDPLPYERVRGPRHFGDPLPVPDDATETVKFLAWIGRDAAWKAPE